MLIPSVNHYVQTNVVVSPWGKNKDKTWKFVTWELSKQPGTGTHLALPERAEVLWREPKSRVGELDVLVEALQLSVSKEDGAGLSHAH